MENHSLTRQRATHFRGSFLALFLLIGANGSIFGQSGIVLLQPYAFEDGGYLLLMHPLNWNRLDTAMPVSYVEEIDRLNAMKAYFRLRPMANISGSYMWADFRFLLCRNGKIVDSWVISSEQRLLQVTSTGKVYQFDGHIPFEGYRLARVQTQEFAQLQAARAALAADVEEKDLICQLPPPWKDKEGRFDVRIQRQPLEREAFTANLYERLAEAMPGVPVYLEVVVNHADYIRGIDYEVGVHTTREMYDHFPIPVAKKTDWKPYPLLLTSYWKVE